MGTTLSPARENFPVLEGLPLINRGKVRDTYAIDNDYLLIVASDAVSIFDHVLNTTIPRKGIVLNLLSHLWFQRLAEYGIPTHMVATGTEINPHLPKMHWGNDDLLARSMVVGRLRMVPVEFIARAYLTGSGLKAYNETGMVCGHTLPKGMRDGDKLPFVLDTPTTKAEVGHDEHLRADIIRAKYPEETYLLTKTFQLVSSYLYERGILLADTKLEMGRFGRTAYPIIGDEVFTPDSSRFWERSAWEELNASHSGKTPPPFDKQVIRNWGLTLGINQRKPEVAEDVGWVHEQEVPSDLVNIATATYYDIFKRITGQTPEQYAQQHLGVTL
ncbi:MAG: phosphoribosylaminoimidazolesuccinocarboxamide synthase [Patescibacteria group bacterium]